MAKSRDIATMTERIAKRTSNITCSACAIAKQRLAIYRKTTNDYKPTQYTTSDTCRPIALFSTSCKAPFLSHIHRHLHMISRPILPLREQERRNNHAEPLEKMYEGRTRQFYRTDNEQSLKSRKTTQA